MSLVRPATAFGSCKLHSDNHGMVCSTESYSSDSYDPKYFLNSPSEVQTSSSDVLENPFLQPHVSSSFDQFNYDSEYPESQSPASVEYHDKLRLKLQELERALLDDNNGEQDDDVFRRGQSMDVDVAWAGPIHNVLLHDSPKECSCSDSSLSSISSSKEITGSTQIPRQMLFTCASAIQDGRIAEASCIINELRQRVSIQGDPSERIAAYMVEALAARIAISGKGLYKALKCKEAPSSERLAAMQVLFEICPCFRFGFMAANAAILEAFKGEKRVHIIDFDINQGSQYYTLLKTLSTLPGKPPHLRLTGVDDPESVQRSVGGLNIIGQRLAMLAEDLNLPFEFQAVAAQTAVVSPSMLNLHPEEAIIVNFAFQLHHMPDESVSTVNERDQLLRMVKSLNPKLVTVVEQDVNTNTAPFLPRFAEAYNYYSAVFESLDAALPRDSQDRMNVEKQCLARDIINIVACEGEERIERYEVAGKWRARMMMAGFVSCQISQNVKDDIKKVIELYSDRYKMKEEAGTLHFAWEDKTLIVASAWM